MRKYVSEIVIALILVVILACFVEPFGFQMPKILHWIFLGLLFIVFSVFALFVCKERFADEREQYHGLVSARFAYLSGASILVIGITVEAFSHTINPWLPVSLGVMVLAKVATRLWAEGSR